MRIFEVSRAGYVPKIRIINLVDILLVLLLFLFATTTFRVDSPSAVKLSLPEAKSAEELGKEKIERLLITIGPDETIYVDSRSVGLGALEQVLTEAKTQNPRVTLQLSADKQVSYGRVVAIVDAARVAGIQEITAFTKKSVQ